MLIPWGTDAPIYHWPIATAGLIVANVAAFAIVPADQYEAWCLAFGEGLHPLQWITSSFLHANFDHLLGNMLFLWAFGIVVEGKLGWARFLAVYLAICLLDGLLIQLFMWRADSGRALGASSAIFGLMSMCLVWAPRNVLHFVAPFQFFFPMAFDVSILFVAGSYIAIEFLFVALTSLAMSSALLHASGAAIGFGAAVLLLHFDLVDCENWDLVAVMGGRVGQSKDEVRKARLMAKKRLPSLEWNQNAQDKRRKKSSKRNGPVEDPQASATRRLQEHLQKQENEAALAVYKKARDRLPRWELSERDWRNLVKGVVELGIWEEASNVLLDYLKASQNPDSRIRLKLAQILIRHQERPAKGLEVLEAIPPGSLPDSLERTRKELARRAQDMVEDGVLEIDEDAR